MARPLAKSSFVLLVIGLWILSCPPSWAEDDDPNALNQQVYQLIEQGKYQEAIPIAERAVEVAEHVRGPEDLQRATSLNSLALLYQYTVQYVKAEPLYQTALRIYQKILGPEHPDTATSLNNLGRLYWDMGEYAKAEPLYQEALRIRQKILSPDDPKTASSLNNLAELYEAMGQFVKAEPLLQDALRIHQKILGPEHPDIAGSLNNLAALYKDMGEYAKAEPLLQEALRIYQKVLGPEHLNTAMSLNNLAEVYEEMGQYVKAEPLYQEALRICRKVLGPEHPDTANTLSNLGGLYREMGEYAQAEPLYQEALRIQQKILGPDHPDTAGSLNNLASLYDDMGNYAKAEPLFQEGIRICRKVLGPEHPEVASGLNNLALLYQAMKEYAKAEPLYQQALRIFQKALGPEHPDTANTLSNLGGLYREMGEYAQAEPLYQEALRFNQKVLGPEHPSTANSLNNLGVLYQDMGELAKAEPLYKEALRIRQKTLGPDHPETANSLDNLSALEFDLGHIDEATALARQASATQLAILKKMFSFTSEQQRLAYSELLNPYSLLTLLNGSEADLAAAVLRYKGVVLDSIIEDRLLAEENQGSEDRKLLERLNLDKSQLGQLLLQPTKKLSVDANQQIEMLQADVEKIEGQLAQRVASLGYARHALGVSLEQVESTIPNDGALIEYLRYWHYLGGKGKWELRYGAILLFSKGAPLWISLGKANEIEHLIRKYGAVVRGSSQEEELSANLQALYKSLWAPIGQALPSQTRRIIISPDGELNFISFATLLTKDKQFLAQTYDVQYVASGRDLLREIKPSTAKEVVLFANPAFDLASTPMLAKADHRSADAGSVRGSEKRDIEDWSFKSLDGTQRERDELIKKFDGWGWTPTDFTAKDATKEALLKIHSPYILHLATHGFFAKEDPNATQTDALLNGKRVANRT